MRSANLNITALKNTAAEEKPATLPQLRFKAAPKVVQQHIVKCVASNDFDANEPKSLRCKGVFCDDVQCFMNNV
jgi:hypothetical protein